MSSVAGFQFTRHKAAVAGTILWAVPLLVPLITYRSFTGWTAYAPLTLGAIGGSDVVTLPKTYLLLPLLFGLCWKLRRLKLRLTTAAVALVMIVISEVVTRTNSDAAGSFTHLGSHNIGHFGWYSFSLGFPNSWSAGASLVIAGASVLSLVPLVLLAAKEENEGV